VKKGDRVPFNGVLLTPDAMATIISNYEKQIRMLMLELEKIEDVSMAEMDSNQAICRVQILEFKTKLKTCVDESNNQRKLFYDELKQYKKIHRSPPWYTNPYLSFIVGGVVVGGICVAVDYAE
jgi:hypothetical protein